jgi:putative MATE family efflux protein
MRGKRRAGRGGSADSVARARAATLLEGPVWRAMVMLALPIVLANVLLTVYQLTDTFWLGRLGPEAVAAVSLSFPILFLLLSLGGGLAIAGGILVAQAYGARNQRAVDHYSAQTLLAVGLASIALSVIGYLLSPAMVRLLGPEPEVADLAIDYLQISFAGLLFQFLYVVFQTILRSVGDVKTPFLIVLFTVILNFFLDPLFIMGWGPVPAMGVGGAALATVGTQGIAAVIGMVLLFQGRVGVTLRATDLRPDYGLMLRMFRLGIPASLEQSTRAAGIAMMAVLVTGFGTAVLAAYGIGARILSFVIIPALGFSMATSTMVGQAVGAGKLDRAEQVAISGSRIAFVTLLVLGGLLYLTALPLTTIFLPNAPEEAAMGAQFVRILALSFAFTGVQQVLAGAFRGAGDTMAAMMLAILALWVLRFPLAFLLSTRTEMGYLGLWWSFPISEVVAAVVAWIWFRSGRWRGSGAEDRGMERAVIEEAIIEEGIER